MRFYLKLILFAALFVVLSRSATRDAVGELSYALRVKYVLAFGSQQDYELLVDETQRALAARCGRLDVYEAGKRYHALLEQRLADAARRRTPLTDHEVEQICVQCAREVYQRVAEPSPHEDNAAHGLPPLTPSPASTPSRISWE